MNINLKKSCTFLSLLSLFWLLYSSAFGFSGTDYMQRFNQFMQWNENLPLIATPEFIAFIQEDAPLSKKLRSKWLYQLARNKDWQQYLQYYTSSTDLYLVCYAELAKNALGQNENFLENMKPIWLVGTSQPEPCNKLFQILLKDPSFDEKLITQRIELALEKRNISLAYYLLKLYKKPRLEELKILQSIYQNPIHVAKLTPNELQDDFYLYGLKRLVTTNMPLALALWAAPNTKKILNEKQQQNFLSFLAIYKAMRNNDDTAQWFGAIKPAYYTNLLLDWQIRFALKNQNWKQVEHLIALNPDKDLPCWQYWLARAKFALGDKKQAKIIYENLAKTRNYYGFLSSLKLKKSLSFENELPANPSLLTPYQPFMDNIKQLYLTKHTLEASRLLNDFMSELPKDDASALVFWIDNELQWHGKSVFLSNTELLNNQLHLRFPLAYKDIVVNYSKNYQLPQAFIYAIIRQESAFREDVTSSAGARGLMQLMPATASMVAKKEKIGLTDQKQLFIQQKNINLGVAYLSHLARRFGKNPILLATAYNAGPKQLQYWLKNHPPKQMDIWIETLPWQETRNYLKNVVAFYMVYQYRMQIKPNLKQIMQTL